ncbi:MAG: cytochrome c oxidase subunit 3, partial [Rickettsiales bacterium]
MSLFNRDTTSSHADHPYHLVNPSPWPALGSFALLLTMIGALMFMHNKTGGGILTIV